MLLKLKALLDKQFVKENFQIIYIEEYDTSSRVTCSSLTNKRKGGTRKKVTNVHFLFQGLFPRLRHNDEGCIKAEDKDLQKLKKFNAYEVVNKEKPTEQQLLTMYWVLHEKLTEDGDINCYWNLRNG